VQTIARCLRNWGADQNDLERPDANAPVARDFWKRCFNIRARYSTLEEALESQGLAECR